MRFRDRHEAGRRLAERLDHLRGEDPVVLALPRGGVPVAAEVADHLGCPMDVLVVRKLGLPASPSSASARSARAAPPSTTATCWTSSGWSLPTSPTWRSGRPTRCSGASSGTAATAPGVDVAAAP